MLSRITILENENTRLIAEATSESKRVEDLLRSIAHDLRNSLASVLTGSEVLLAVDSSPDAKPLLQSIQRQANVMARVVDRLVEDFRGGPTPSVSEGSSNKLVDLRKVLHSRIPLRILAIDDRRDVLLPLRILLTKEGHEFAEAEDGSSGLQKLATFKPEIVLCDIDLHGELSGLDIAHQIRAQRDSSSIYLVAISGSVQACDMENSANAGFDFHIAKPITANAIRNLIYNRPKFEIA